MNIAIIGNNETLEFFINSLILNHNVKWYITNKDENLLDINKKIIQKNFYENNIMISNNIIIEEKKLVEITINEFFLFRNKNKKENYYSFKSYSINNNYSFVPSLEVIENTEININQINFENDVVIVDTNNKNILNQIDIKNKNEINNYKILKENKELDISIFKNKVNYNYCDDYLYIKTRKEIKNKNIIIKNKGFKKEKYSYGKICIINNSLEEYSNSYQDYCLLVEIINQSTNKNIYYNLDLYSNIKINLY